MNCFRLCYKIRDKLFDKKDGLEAKYQAIMEEGEKRIKKDFDMIKLIRDVRNLKLLCSYKLKPSHRTIIHLNTSEKNVIDLLTPIQRLFNENKIDKHMERIEKRNKKVKYNELEMSMGESDIDN
jgi:hypothetical protein